MNKHPLGIASLALAAALCGSSGIAAQEPNILILYADDMGYGDLGANNPASKIPTPHLDRLAASGMRFTDGHSSSGICTPSRYAMLTGRHHWRDFHGIVGAFGKSVFKDGQLTMPGMLRERGYETAAIGKWHLGWDWDAIRKPDSPPKSDKPYDFDWSKPVPGGPLDRGFDHYFGDDVINFPPYAWIEDDRVIKAPDVMLDTSQWKPIKEGSWEARKGPMVRDWDPYEILPTLTRRGVEYIRSRKDSDQPFFLYFAYPSPHAPIIPNDAFDGKSQAGPYGDFVFETDDSVGQLLAALEESGLADNTIVVFSADNGPENYAYARDAKYDHWSSAPFRGLKRDIYEGGHHVPFLIRWPGMTRPGSVSDALISQVDLMATFAALTGAELPGDAATDSFDFLPYLRGASATGPRTAMVQNTYKDRYALREGDWLLIDAKSGYTSREPSDQWHAKHGYTADDDLPVELYNLREDIGQRHNLAANHPERVKSMQALLKQIRNQGYSTTLRLPPTDNAAEGLKSASAAAGLLRATKDFMHYTTQPTDNPLLNRMGLPKKNSGFARKGFHLWDPSIIKVGDTYHLFASCWPDDDFQKWKQSYVIRATSKNLLGPYEYVEDVLHPRPGDYFDSAGVHNPKISFHDGKYYLYHLGIPKWQSGVAVSDSVEGPWTRFKEARIPANNPALWIHDDGSVYGVGKVKVPNPEHPGSREFNHLLHYIQAFEADTIMGPYRKLHKPRENALPENFQNEDPCIWYDGTQYHMLLTDLHGYATGKHKAFTYYTSKDGLNYNLVSKTPLLANQLPVKFDDGSEIKYRLIERPNIVLDEEGDVIAILAACRPKTGGAVILVFPVEK